MTAARYLIGVDLGTTNSLLSCIDTQDSGRTIRSLEIPQCDRPGVVSSHLNLPSALYLPLQEELRAGAFQVANISDADWCVGMYALEQSAFSPERTVTSAKSWLCSDAVARGARILPWMSDEISTENRISPIEASSIYLAYLKRVWEKDFPDATFLEAEITVTVPASFDEDAQLLTLQAAHAAGYPQSTRLLEEPQAAFYDWISTHQSAAILETLLPELVRKPQRVLVCDVGGGTTDFSLFEIAPRKQTDLFHEISRVAVSDHVLLGGDNIDRTVAHQIEQLFLHQGSAELTRKQWHYILAQARRIKEQVLAERNTAESITVTLPGEGSRLISSTQTGVFYAAQAREFIVEGFFPMCSPSDRPKRSSAALRERGLPYATDSRVSVYLAEFLAGQSVNAVLFNGGMLKPAVLRNRLAQCISSWQGGGEPIVLEHSDLDKAVSKGAAFYALARRQQERVIRGGYARSLYLELAGECESTSLLCIIPQGAETGLIYRSERKFLLSVNQPVKFQAFSASRRLEDEAGHIVSYDKDSFHKLPTLQTVLRLSQRGIKITSGTLEVRITASVNDLGLAQIAFESESGEERWGLEFNTRIQAPESSAVPQSERYNLDPPAESFVKQVETLLAQYYGKSSPAQAEPPKRLLEEIEQIFGVKRGDLPVKYLRALWPPLLQGMTRKGRSIIHEVAWLSLAGYALRPGYGVQLDEWRVQELSQCLKLGLSFPKEARVMNQWWIMWRRVAGGLPGEQQEKLAAEAIVRIEKGTADSVELIRALGAFERISLEAKRRIVKHIVMALQTRKQSSREHLIWALRRIAARVPLHATVDCVVPPALVMEWFEALAALDWQEQTLFPLCGAFAQACRRTGDRERDLTSDVLAKIRAKLIASSAKVSDIRLLEEIIPVALDEQQIALGDSLPVGLQLVF